MTRCCRWLSVSLAAVGSAGPALAQTPFLSGGASIVNIHSQGVGSGGPTRSAGTMLGGLATARFGRVEVEGRYVQGALQPQDGTSPRRDLVQGQLAVGFRPVSWAYARTAARARAYITPAETERWVMWLVGVGVETPLVGTAVRGDVGLWRALAVSANVGATEGRTSRGGEAGVTLQFADRPWWVRLAYGIDRSAVSSAGRRETVEEFTLTLGVRRR